MFKQEPILQEVQVLADLRRQTFVVPHMEVAFMLFFFKVGRFSVKDRISNYDFFLSRQCFPGKKSI